MHFNKIHSPQKEKGDQKKKKIVLQRVMGKTVKRKMHKLRIKQMILFINKSISINQKLNQGHEQISKKVQPTKRDFICKFVHKLL